MKSIVPLVIVFSLIFISCVDEFEQQITGDKNYLIVEAFITNANEPYEVVLTRTLDLDNKEKISYETGANVTIEDSKGNTYSLTEDTEGKYYTNPSEFVGQFNETYILTIYTSDGNIYESDPVELKEVIGIEELTITFDQSYNYDLDRNERGLNINVTTEPWQSGSSYYIKWDYVETWKLYPTYSVMNNPEIPHIPCYNIEKNSEIIMENTSDYTTDRIVDKQIIYLNEFDTKPYFGYSVLVRQTALNEAVYRFWTMLKENTEETGDVFDKIPYNAIGNIHCITDDDKKVFGYFSGSEVKEKRISFKPPYLGIKFLNFYDNCTMLVYDSDEFNYYLSLLRVDSSDVYVYDQVDGQIMFFLRRECVDCSQTSTTTIKPDYWIYD